MINKAMIEIPPRFAGRPPVNPEFRATLLGGRAASRAGIWRGAQGLAEDVRYYGKWMRDEAERRIGHLYPKVKAVREKDGTFRHATGAEIAASLNPEPRTLTPRVEDLTVIAWLWARTIESSNPAYRGCQVPLVSSFWLSTKPGKEAWVEPVIAGKAYRFEVRTIGSASVPAGLQPADKERIAAGTKLGRGANFRCILSQAPVLADYIRSEAQAGRMGARLMAIVCEDEHEAIARQARPEWKPDQKVTTPCHDVDRLPMYGMYTWGMLLLPGSWWR